jgi:hypothetical protein
VTRGVWSNRLIGGVGSDRLIEGVESDRLIEVVGSDRFIGGLGQIVSSEGWVGWSYRHKRAPLNGILELSLG